MPVMPFRVVNEAQAAQYRSITEGREHVLDPKRIEAGPRAGSYAFSEAVMFNPAYSDMHDLIRVAAPSPTTLDTDIAWPPEEEQ